MTSWLPELEQALRARRRGDEYRVRRVVASAQGARVVIDGREFLNFSSNDYLGFAHEPELIEKTRQAVADYGSGSGASHLVAGHQDPHHQLEQRLAELTGRDRALVFSTGYTANHGVLTTLLGKGDTVFQDKLNHASLLDGALASGARLSRYRHGDIDHLEQLLARHQGGRRLLAVDSVFSMDGDLAPLQALAATCEAHDVVMMIDDAHGFGVLGESGMGAAEHFALDQQRLPILMATLGKAVGAAGAFVAGSDALIETLIQFCRPYIYSTAMPAATAVAALQAIELNRAQPARRRHLHSIVRYYRHAARQLGLPLGDSDTAIQPLLLGSSESAVKLSDALFREGILAVAIRPPTVPVGSARLRLTLTAKHSEQDVDQLLQALDRAYGRLGLPREAA